MSDGDPRPGDPRANPDGPGSTSASLIEGVKRRDPEHERRLLFLYEPLVLRRCAQQVFDREDVRDITQEVFATAFARIDEFTLPAPEDRRPGAGGFRSWLYAILRNKIGDHIRRRAHEPAAVGGTDAHEAIQQVGDDLSTSAAWSDGAPADGPTDEALLARRALELARSEFEDATWRAACLVLVEARPAAEVAAELGVKREKVYVSKARVLKRVRAILADLGETPSLPGAGLPGGDAP